MQIVLLETIEKLGELGDTVSVKRGYARNYLIPKQIAVRATPQALAKVEKRRQQLLKEEKERLDVAKARTASAAKELTFVRKVIEGQDRLFGSVTITDVIQQAAEAGTELLRAEITLPEEGIKTVGDFSASIKFHPEISFDIKLIVVADSSS